MNALKDFAVCVVAAVLVHLLVFDIAEDFYFTKYADDQENARNKVINAMAKACVSGDRNGSGCEYSMCYVTNHKKPELFCKAKEEDEEYVLVKNHIKVSGRKKWMDEYAPEGLSTSRRRIYGVLFVLGVAGIMKFLLIPKQEEKEEE